MENVFFYMKGELNLRIQIFSFWIWNYRLSMNKNDFGYPETKLHLADIRERVYFSAIRVFGSVTHHRLHHRPKF